MANRFEVHGLFLLLASAGVSFNLGGTGCAGGTRSTRVCAGCELRVAIDVGLRVFGGLAVVSYWGGCGPRVSVRARIRATATGLWWRRYGWAIAITVGEAAMSESIMTGPARVPRRDGCDEVCRS